MSDRDREQAIDRFRQAVQGVWLDVLYLAMKADGRERFFTLLDTARGRTDELARKFCDHTDPPEPAKPQPSANGEPKRQAGAKQ
jgi:hypothetical protein